MIKRPPNWRKHLTTQDLFEKTLSSEKLRELVKQAEKDYVYWDTFMYYKMPSGFSAEEAWAYLKFTR